MVYIYRTSAWYGLLPIEPMGMLDQLPVTYCAPPQLVYYYTPPQLAISDHFQGGMRTAWAWMKKFLWENAKSLTAWKFILLILVLCLFYGWESHFLNWYYKHVCWSGDKDGNSKRGSSIEKRKAEKGKIKWGNRHDFCLRTLDLEVPSEVCKFYMCFACPAKNACGLDDAIHNADVLRLLDLRWLDIAVRTTGRSNEARTRPMVSRSPRWKRSDSITRPALLMVRWPACVPDGRFYPKLTAYWTNGLLDRVS